MTFPRPPGDARKIFGRRRRRRYYFFWFIVFLVASWKFEDLGNPIFTTQTFSKQQGSQ